MISCFTKSKRKIKYSTLNKVGFGGGCHWCTEAVFQSLIGVTRVEQGWIASAGENSALSEAVVVHFDENVILFSTLISIHLFTHSCTSEHTMREKYRSAVYTFNGEQEDLAKRIISELQNEFIEPIITRVLPFVRFKENSKEFLNYYYKDPEKQFGQRYIDPKLKLLKENYPKHLDSSKLMTNIQSH